jgi:hypothetical protein
MYECGACEKVFAHRHLYEGHLRAAHPGRAACPRCRAAFPSHVALASHSAICNNNSTQSSATIQITPRLYNNNNSSSNNNSLSLAAAPTAGEASVLGKKKKTKANRPPPKLILISTDTTEYRRLEGSDHIIIQKQPPPPPVAEKVSCQSADPLAESPVAAAAGSVAARKPISIAPKPMESLLSEEAKKILHSSAPRYG